MDSPFIAAEERRLAEVGVAVREQAADRRQQLEKFHHDLAALKTARLAAISWPEKNRLTERIRDKEAYDPAKYLPEFNQGHAPYFAGFTINDQDRQVGCQQYLLGKQNLFHGERVLVVDWRQAAVSALYYEYEPGEEYEEELNGRDRRGILTEKRKYTIQHQELLRLESSTKGVYEKHAGQWRPAGKQQSSSQRKEERGDHHLVDIVSLISPEQFGLITKEYHGCLRLQGSAGAGKTTIALHRLSYLMFNYPQKFRPERCLVLMFNRALRDYVASTVEELLDARTPVDTFHSWAAKSLRVLGLKKIAFGTRTPPEFDPLKKSCGMAQLVADYAATANDAVPLTHLFRMYGDEARLQKYLLPDFEPNLVRRYGDYYRAKLAAPDGAHEIAFADAGPLLRLLQIRLHQHHPGCENIALNYFDHIVIDEAQDLSQLELDSLFYATTPARSLTICADPNQQILNFVDPRGFARFQLTLEQGGLAAKKLEISYRSTAEIMTVANAVLGQETKQASRHGVPVRFHHFSSPETALATLQELVARESEKAPQALLAVICKYKNELDQLYRELRHLPGVRREPQKFQPGVLIINAHQIKGLEFTAVIVWNASARAYREGNEQDRNLLYVVLSRACDRLTVLSHAEPTPYLKDFFPPYI